MNSLINQNQKSIEEAYLRLARISELIDKPQEALEAYENILKTNPKYYPVLIRAGNIALKSEEYSKAAELLKRSLTINIKDGNAWSKLGFCFMMLDDLHKSYNAYQQALSNLADHKVNLSYSQNAELWAGIGMLYDRCNSLEYAEQAIISSLKLDNQSIYASELYFRLGILFKNRRMYDNSILCFKYILDKPPRDLKSDDILFMIGHVYESNSKEKALDVFKGILSTTPNHALALQQIGWIYFQESDFVKSQEYLQKACEANEKDSYSWYLLGRSYMEAREHSQAYEAYQKSIYLDPRNPIFWGSIGLLYFSIGQYRDSLDSFSRAIHINPYSVNVWWNLGLLYEACNNQTNDAIDAYDRALEIDPNNTLIATRLEQLRKGEVSVDALSLANDIVPLHSVTANYTAHSLLGYSKDTKK